MNHFAPLQGQFVIFCLDRNINRTRNITPFNPHVRQFIFSCDSLVPNNLPNQTGLRQPARKQLTRHLTWVMSLFIVMWIWFVWESVEFRLWHIPFVNFNQSLIPVGPPPITLRLCYCDVSHTYLLLVCSYSSKSNRIKLIT